MPKKNFPAGAFVQSNDGPEKIFGWILPKEKVLSRLAGAIPERSCRVLGAENAVPIFRLGSPGREGEILFGEDADYFLRKIFLLNPNKDVEIVTNLDEMMILVRSVIREGGRDADRIKADTQALYIYLQGEYMLSAESVGDYTRQAVRFFEKMEL